MKAAKVRAALFSIIGLFFHPDLLMFAGMALSIYGVAMQWGRPVAFIAGGALLFLIGIATAKKEA